MPISALPEATVRLLGSPLVITTPVSVVKELVENAIDARATSIEVLVSRNTVDKIQVRDNGDGIASCDYDCLGRRGRTSKLRSFEEIRLVGGTSFGFRGEALASANALGMITITTRTSTDPVATKLHLAPGVGGVTNQERTSAPVGTTVSVKDIFASLPVRKKIATKEAPKTISRVRNLLCGYALARPRLRLSFKVIGDNSRSWNYSPQPDAGIKEAVLQVLGPELTAQCLLARYPTCEGHQADREDDPDKSRMEFEAFIPKEDADPTKISKGAYFSVDSRPVSTIRGTMKKLLSIFKAMLSKSLSPGDASRPIRDPFIRINVRCPQGSYDSNVEPSKDEVIFEDEQILVKLFDDFCSSLYEEKECLRTGVAERRQSNGPLGVHEYHHTHTSAKPLSSQTPHAVRGSPLIAAPKYHDSRLVNGRVSEEIPIHCQVSVVPSRPTTLAGGASNHHGQVVSPFQQPTHCFRESRLPQLQQASDCGLTVDMSANVDTSSDGEDGETEDVCSRQHHMMLVEPSDLEMGDSTKSLNPWTIAKMNAPRRLTESDSATSPKPLEVNAPLVRTPTRAESDEELPVLRQPGGPPGDLDIPQTRRQLLFMDVVNTRVSVPGGPYRSPVARSMFHQKPDRRDATQLQTPPPSWQAQRKHRLDLPLRPRHDSDTDAEVDGLVQTTLSFGAQGTRRNKRVRTHLCDEEDALRQSHLLRDNGFSSPIVVPQVGSPATHRRTGALLREHETDDFVVMDGVETPRAKRIRRGRTPFRVHEGSNIVRPHLAVEQSSMTNLDPRARHQRSRSRFNGEGERMSTNLQVELLSLESSVPKDQTSSLVLTLRTSTKEIAEMLARLIFLDTYTTTGGQETGLDMSMGSEEISQLEFRLRKLLRRLEEPQSDSWVNVDIGLSKLLKGKAVDLGA